MEFPESVVKVGAREVKLAYARMFPESSDAWYWASLWPASVALAEAVMTDDALAGKAVLELGCGCGLAGLAAGLQGAKVMVTDVMPEALELAKGNWERNGLYPPRAEELDWCQWNANLPQVDCLLGADILYRPDDYPQLVETLTHLMAPGGCIRLADPGRPGVNDFYARMLRAGYRVASTEQTVALHGEVFEVVVSTFS